MDVVEGVPQGKALDMLESAPVEGYDVRIVGTNGYDDDRGFRHRRDHSRHRTQARHEPRRSADTPITTSSRGVTEQVAKRSPNAILILVTNPLDAMCWTAFKMSGFPQERVIGMAGVLDTARFRTFIAEELHVSVENVTAVVLGGHGDTMVPLVRFSNVSGIPLDGADGPGDDRPSCSAPRDGGAEIVKYLKTGQRILCAGGVHRAKWWSPF